MGRESRAQLTLATDADIADHEGTSIAEIPQRTRLAQSLVSNTVARMSTEGVPTITPDSNDGRRVQINIDPRMRADIFTSRGRRPIASALRGEPTRLNNNEVRDVERLLEELASYLLPNQPR